jgi:hypothetical protein
MCEIREKENSSRISEDREIITLLCALHFFFLLSLSPLERKCANAFSSRELVADFMYSFGVFYVLFFFWLASSLIIRVGPSKTKQKR